MSRTASPIGDPESETLADCGTVSKRKICVFRLWNMRAPHGRDLTVPSSMDQHLLIAPPAPKRPRHKPSRLPRAQRVAAAADDQVLPGVLSSPPSDVPCVLWIECSGRFQLFATAHMRRVYCCANTGLCTRALLFRDFLS